jgi:hypothetical protein
VHDSVATLSGHPASHAEKLAAEKSEQRVAAVKAVVVEMSIRLPQTDVQTDEEMANAARSMLRWQGVSASRRARGQAHRGLGA